jgi:hypothetical protein
MSHDKGYKHRDGSPVSDACGDGKHEDCTEAYDTCGCTYRGLHTTAHAYLSYPTLPPKPTESDAPHPTAPTGKCCDNGNFGDEHECQKQPPNHRVEQLWSIVRDIAKWGEQSPWEFVGMHDEERCYFCGVPARSVDSGVEHEPDCLFRRSRELQPSPTTISQVDAPKDAPRKCPECKHVHRGKDYCTDDFNCLCPNAPKDDARTWLDANRDNFVVGYTGSGLATQAKYDWPAMLEAYALPFQQQRDAALDPDKVPLIWKLREAYRTAHMYHISHGDISSIDACKHDVCHAVSLAWGEAAKVLLSKGVDKDVIDETAITIPALKVRAERAESESAALRQQLQDAVKIIRDWHGMGMPKEAEKMAWDIYFRNAPEMKSIRAALEEKP